MQAPGTNWLVSNPLCAVFDQSKYTQQNSLCSLYGVTEQLTVGYKIAFGLC